MENYPKTTLSIKSWAEEDRPREKLILKGRSALTDAELVAILIGSGNNTMSAVELSKVILNSVQNDLNRLAKLSLTDLKEFNGIGEAKALSIISALELGRRRNNTEASLKYKIKSSNDIYTLMKSNLLDLPHEEFWIIMLNRANEVLKKVSLSVGGLVGTVVDTRLIFKSALDNFATAIILVHNHPSGNKNPSEADVVLTTKLVKAGQLMEITVLDHVIFTDSGYYSFADESRIV